MSRVFLQRVSLGLAAASVLVAALVEVLRRRRGYALTVVDERKVTNDVIAAGKAWIGRAGMSLDTPWPVI